MKLRWSCKYISTEMKENLNSDSRYLYSISSSELPFVNVPSIILAAINICRDRCFFLLRSPSSFKSVEVIEGVVGRCCKSLRFSRPVWSRQSNRIELLNGGLITVLRFDAWTKKRLLDNFCFLWIYFCSEDGFGFVFCFFYEKKSYFF